MKKILSLTMLSAICASVTLPVSAKSILLVGEVTSHLPKMKIDTPSKPILQGVKSRTVKLSQNDSGFCKVSNDLAWVKSPDAGTEKRCYLEFVNPSNGFSPRPNLTLEGVPQNAGSTNVAYKLTYFSGAAKTPVTIHQASLPLAITVPSAPVIVGVGSQWNGGNLNPNAVEVNDRNAYDNFAVKVEQRDFDQMIKLDGAGHCFVPEGQTSCKIEMNLVLQSGTAIVGQKTYAVKANSANEFFPTYSNFNFVSKWDFTPPTIEFFDHQVVPSSVEKSRTVNINGHDVQIVNNIAKVAISSVHDKKGGNWWVPAKVALEYTPKENQSFENLVVEDHTLFRSAQKPSTKALSVESSGAPVKVGKYYVYDVDVSKLNHGKYTTKVETQDKYANGTSRQFGEVGANRAETEVGLFYDYAPQSTTGVNNFFFSEGLIVAAFNGLHGDSKLTSVTMDGKPVALTSPNSDNSYLNIDTDALGFKPYSTHSIEIKAQDGFGIEYKKRFDMVYMPINFYLSNVPDEAYATIQKHKVRLENQGSKCAFMTDDFLAKASARAGMHTCSIKWTMVPEGFSAVTMGKSYLLAGTFENAGANKIAYEVTMFNHQGKSRTVPSDIVSIDVKEAPVPIIEAKGDSRYERLENGMFLLSQEGGYFAKPRIESAPADINFTVKQGAEITKEAKINQRSRGQAIQSITVPVKNLEGKLWQQVEFDMVASYDRAPHLKGEAKVKGVFVPPRGVKVAMDVDDRSVITTQGATVKVSIGQYDRSVRGYVYDAGTMGQWTVHLANKVSIRDIEPITAPVEVDQNGVATFQLEADKIGEFGGKILAVAELVSKVEGYSRNLMSRPVYMRVFKGEKLDGDLVSNTIEDTLPMKVRIKYKPESKSDKNSLGDIKWQISRDSSSWSNLDEYANRRGIYHTITQPGEHYIRAVVTNAYTSEVTTTEAIHMIAYEKPLLNLEGERAKIEGEEFAFTLTNMGSPADEAEGIIEWSTDRGQTWEKGSETYSFGASSDVKYIMARMRYHHADGVSDKAWSEVSKSLKIMPIMVMDASIDMPRKIEVGQPATLVGTPKLPYFGIERPFKTQWVRQNGEIVEGNELSIIIDESDIIDDKGSFTFQAWMEGRKDETLFNKEVTITAYRYELPSLALKVTPRTKVAPAEVKVEVEMGRITAPDVEIETKLQLTHGMTLEKESIRYATVIIKEPGIHELIVRVTDNRGNNIELKEFIELLEPEPMSIVVADYLSTDVLRQPVTSIMRPKVELGHPLDKVVSYEWYLNDKKVSDIRIGEFKDMKAGLNIGKLVVKTEYGQVGELPIMYDVAENKPPVCEIEKGESISSVYFVANCKDEDGEMVAYKWLVDGEREVTGRKISFVKTGRDSVHISLKGYDDSGDSGEAETSVAM